MLELHNIDLSVGGRRLISGLSLGIKPGEIVTVMGESGSGKSSLLSYIGGDLDPAFTGRGIIKLNETMLNGLAPERRHIARLFQDDLLFPHMTIGENLLFAVPKMPQNQRRDMMHTALRRAELEGFETRAPHTLSGGQRARISLMRALLSKPAAILLDEPFNKLDQTLRQSIRDYVFSHIRARDIPALLVTHDAADAPPGGRIITLPDMKRGSDA